MNNSRFGFKYGDLETIIQVLSKFPEIERAVIFGSRAKGNHQRGSDVDIAVWTKDEYEAWQLPGMLNDETLLPYKFDVLNFNKINNPELKQHITRAGVEIYEPKAKIQA
ncbi:nucleotidyltransferase domain-containing protein [uncultured Mucilaginibacter sp.]|uniref:nucleotidyltransferase domain-containing protein n=1 Tax=uncultured Mucilaginibacter sp. TaxID=797541 RepID=UPI0025E00FA0|nr:nucleotidyltransferase domain-containing protein [uncultured Mucilaginibacter sp.]